jgi:hypothetical protein
MKWVLGVAILFAVGYVLRRVLRLDGQPGSLSRGLSPLAPLGTGREAVYRPVALELDTHAAILGISLNEAFEERDRGNMDLAWRLIRLTASEWGRMVDIVAALLATMNKYMPAVNVAGPVRGMSASRFKSKVMLEFAPLHEVVNQLVFRSKLKFQVHTRILRRAAETLTTDFRRLCRAGETPENRSPEVWKLFDLEFHDFDLITKEVLLALRAFLAGLPDSEIPEFATELAASLPRGVRSATWDLSKNDPKDQPQDNYPKDQPQTRVGH